MSLNFVSLKEVISKPISGEWGDGEGITNVLRTTNFTNDGKLDLNEVVQRNIDQKKVEKKQLIYGDTIIEKSGGSPSQPVGRVVYFDQHDGIYLCNNFTSVIRAKPDIDSRYLFWFLFNNHLTKNTLQYQNKTTGIINLQLERYIEEIKIPLSPLATQKRIAEILDAADALRRKDQELLKKYDELAQAIFIDMFGDPVKNEKNYALKNFFEIFAVTTGKKDSNASIKDGEYPFFTCSKEVLRISNFSYDFECLLLAGNNAAGVYDVKYYNGKFDAYQRTYILKLNSTDNNYLFFKFILERYLGVLQKSSIGSGTKYLTLDIFKRLNFFEPGVEMQNKFGHEMTIINRMKSEVLKEESKNLFNSLIQKAFTGELVA
jgi:type I restriction enzyme S subunit